MKAKITLLGILLSFLAFQSAKALVYTAEVPAGTEKCYIVGEKVTGSWSTFMEMARVEGTNRFTIEIAKENIENEEYSYSASPSWEYEETDETGTPKSHKQWSALDVVSTWMPHGDLTLTANVPAGTTEVVVLGSYNGWAWEGAIYGTKNSDGTFSFTFPNVGIVSYRLYNKLDWSYYEVNEQGEERPDRKANFSKDNNSTITVIGWVNPLTTNDITKAIKTAIKVVDKTIALENVFGKVALYNANGQLIEVSSVQGNFVSKELSQGIYILKADGVLTKVVIQ